jgi:acetoin utilization deacetylase AcuC-like enzyme
MAIGYDPRCLLHDNGSMVLDSSAVDWIEVEHAENARRVERAHAVLKASGVLGRIDALPTREASDEELLLVHTEAHLERISRLSVEAERTSGSGRQAVLPAGPEARIAGHSLEAARIAAGVAIEAVDHVFAAEDPDSTAGSEEVRQASGTTRGTGRRAFSLTRPPGHHASADQAMGFCLFNSAALAVRHAQRGHGIERVALLDWDVHHGNGTQAVFYDDPSVLFVSLHQDGLYPEDQGRVGERGEGEGVGTNINLPLPAGTGDAGYLAAMEEVALPAIAGFGPQLIVLSSGQDAGACDPLGRMSVTAEGFREMTAGLALLADEQCEGRIVAVQEGGYSVDHMPFCVLATVEALAGMEPSLEGDPVEMDVPSGIKPAEVEAIRAAARASGLT